METRESFPPSGEANSATTHRAGFVVIAGRPSAGKSTLLNRLLGRKLAIVSPKPQTTRHKLLGILTRADYQAVFIDTPGWLDSAADELQNALRRAARLAAKDDGDVVVWVADRACGPADLVLLSSMERWGHAMLLALSKSDLPGAAARLDDAENSLRGAAPWKGVHRLSSLTGGGVDAFEAAIAGLLPESPPLYPVDELSDRYERFFAAELVRERIFALYEEEIPHACAVEIDEYREREGRADEIRAIIYVEREAHKPILIGRNGQALRRLCGEAQAAIAAFTGRPARLELWIKVRQNWRRDPAAVRSFGY